MRLEYITIYLLMKRIISYKNAEQYQWPLTLFDSHWHAMCVYIKKYVS